VIIHNGKYLLFPDTFEYVIVTAGILEYGAVEELGMHKVDM
jgi:hypothetical protein